MISFQQARDIAEKIIQNKCHGVDVKLIIVDDQIIDKPYAWIFPYTSKQWLEGDFNYALAGNSPLFVEKQDGRVSTFRTGLSVEGMIDEYEELNKTWSLKIPTSIYSNKMKLLALKRHINLTQLEITELKLNNINTVVVGSKNRLNRLAELLKMSEIENEIVLTSGI